MIIEYVEGVSIFTSTIRHVIFPVVNVNPSARLGICPHHAPHSPMTCKEFNKGQFLRQAELCVQLNFRHGGGKGYWGGIF